MRYLKALRCAGWALGVSCTLPAILAGGCSSSEISRDSDDQLRRAVRESIRRESAEALQYPERRVMSRETGGVGRLRLSQDVLDEIDRTSGPESYRGALLAPADNLLGNQRRIVAISLERAVKSCVENNLQVQFARIAPAVSEARVVQAEAAFDWTFFQNLTYNNIDQPRARTSLFPSTTGLTSDQQQNVISATGLRQRLTTGGQLTVQQDLTYTDSNTPGQVVAPDPNSALAVSIQFDQPLLRNFGSDVALSEVRLARNAERSAVAQLKRDLIRTVNDVEKNYWQLLRAYRDLLILQRLLERGVEVRDQLQAREFDVQPAQLAAATARVERRRADIRRAQNALRQLSDRLKLLINDPDLPVGGEAIIIPLDDPSDEPIEYSLIDSIETAIASRPEVQQSILSMDDTSIRQAVADSGRLPQLDLRLQTRWWALQEHAGNTYNEVFDGSFVDYIVGLAFEQPIGNRRAEAEYRARRLERSQAVISYRNTLQQVLQEVKGSLENVTTFHELIELQRVARVAAAEELRTLLVEKETIAGYTVERLDLELSRQDALAQAERDEISALTDYHSSIADLYASMGTSLERNRIDFVVPDAREVLVVRPPRARSADPGRPDPAEMADQRTGR
ncbi:MAG: TolC family protein [Phycisphaeraceae bacterium]|nr:TolC family protein [Phycisphaerae bacterium]MBX3393284.1 TolC family protein [Phycisphaeraceae bacterium]